MLSQSANHDSERSIIIFSCVQSWRKKVPIQEEFRAVKFINGLSKSEWGIKRKKEL